MGFQTQVYINPAQGLPGDFASSNPMTGARRRVGTRERRAAVARQ